MQTPPNPRFDKLPEQNYSNNESMNSNHGNNYSGAPPSY